MILFIKLYPIYLHCSMNENLSQLILKLDMIKEAEVLLFIIDIIITNILYIIVDISIKLICCLIQYL